MNQEQVRDSLIQVLENYQRCGLRFAPREELSPGLQGYVESLQGGKSVAHSPSVTPTNPSVTPSATPSRAEPPPQPNDSAPVATGAGATSVTPPIEQPQNWKLPVLGLEDRTSRMAAVDQEVKSCRACKNIVGFRQQTVLGVGTLQPTICFMGEAPGADEDRQGIPFVGKAGQLLTKIIGAMKLKREDVYILNALKCRPPQNRTPVPDEIDSCRGYVETQLEILQPKYIVCLGAVAVRSILQSSQSIGRLRGKFHNYRGARVIVTYHPSYLLRNESAKRLVWDDMKMLMREMGVEL